MQTARDNDVICKPEMVQVKRSKTEAILQVSLMSPPVDGQGGLIATLSDATELKSLEAQFVQSQKMQAIGQLAGGVAEPHGAFDSSMQLLNTGLFGDFKRLHVAGHPEGNRDIDPDGSTRNVDEALRWKQAFSDRTDAKMALATQFAFEAKPCLLYTSPSPRDLSTSRMPSSA